MHLDGMEVEHIDFSGEKTMADCWILSRFNETAGEVTRLFDTYEFGEAGRHLYSFIWDDLCDWYIEMAKLPLYGDDEEAKQTTRSVLAYVLERTLRLLHPLMPFITEEIWQHLPHEGDSITVAKWPEGSTDFADADAVKDMNLLKEVIRSVRNIRAEVNVPPSKKIDLQIKAENDEICERLKQNRSYLENFCNPESLVISKDLTPPDKSMSAHLTGVALYLPLAGLIDIEEEVGRLEKEREKLNNEVERVRKKLANENFVSKAPENIVDEERDKEKDYLNKRRKVEDRIAELKA
jgi:valyl-tRNA synthetase